ncbi:dihydroxyacetone kinase subunit DhaL [Treponema primitia]|uniref:dihydroxyacetone kinase subunit DhaL n=1 Tax=Treponema primitia TaxID=88058 RepID=UPI0002554C1F|nr:dihydroxyacetone kinase subunit DhaL [Treponema primitia]
MGGFKVKDGKPVLLKMVAGIQQNKDYLGEVDGLIGDGDHGMNMNKGFTMFAEQIAAKDIGFTEGLDELGNLLFSKIGGSMGPIYGSIFMSMAESIEDLEEIDTADVSKMVNAGLDGLHEVVKGEVGDKTLVDTLAPANEALKQAAKAGKSLPEALEEMKAAAAKGRDSTKDLVAKFGRSSRLGERSRGVLDAGAVSCCIILTTIADGIVEQLRAGA